MKKTIILFCILILGISISIFPLNKASANNLQTQLTCTINLVANTQNCDGMPNITFAVPPTGGKTVVKLNMTYYKHVRFDVTYNSTPTGWTVNIGDSATNDGYGGDAGTQSRDAEMQVVNTSMAVYGSDHNVIPGGLLASFSNAATTSYPLIIDVKSEYLKWSIYGSSHEIVSPCPDPSGNYVCALFALGNTSDQWWETEGQVNDDLYAAFNRVINGDYRSGSGVSQIIITLYMPEQSGPVLVDR